MFVLRVLTPGGQGIFRDAVGTTPGVWLYTMHCLQHSANVPLLNCVVSDASCGKHLFLLLYVHSGFLETFAALGILFTFHLISGQGMCALSQYCPQWCGILIYFGCLDFLHGVLVFYQHFPAFAFRANGKLCQCGFTEKMVFWLIAITCTILMLAFSQWCF